MISLNLFVKDVDSIGRCSVTMSLTKNYLELAKFFLFYLASLDLLRKALVSYIIHVD